MGGAHERKPDQPDILVFMTDQHTATVMGCAGDRIVSTPHLDRLAGDGVIFDCAYSACPLCVPARSAMLTGRQPARTGMLTNSDVIPSDQATFAHSLAAAGYETVLCGRMHFLGPDQRHGFTRRLVGDFTPCYHGRYGKVRSDLGPYVGTPAGEFTKLYGGGNSPVLEYDRAVIRAALECLERPHERPLFLLVGTYGPHHTFVAPEELYRKYLELVPEPASRSARAADLHPAVALRRKDIDPEVTRRLRAAYYGMVEQIDGQLGEVRAAWREHLVRSGRRGSFCYLSDHGEQAGEKDLWGKMTFYDASARIPLIFEGAGVSSAGRRVAAACSIMDLGPTLCELAGAEAPPEQDGVSLAGALAGAPADEWRAVLSDVLDGEVLGRMVRHARWKFVAYAGHPGEDQLFDMEADPGEYENSIAEHPETAADLRARLLAGWDPEAILAEHRRRQAHWKLLSAWGARSGVEEPERWKVPESSWELPRP